MRDRTRNYLSTILLAALMAPALYFAIIQLRAVGIFQNDPPGIIWLAVLFIAIGLLLNSYVHTLLHETGHLLFGLCNRFFCYSFRIGPFCLTRSGGKAKLSFTLKNHYGTCIMVPKAADGFYRHSAWKIMGGPIFSLLLAAASWVILYLGTSWNEAWYTVLGVGAVVNTYMFLREVLPYANATTENDGAQLIGIWKRTPRMQVNLKLFALQCLIMEGTRPSEIDEEMLFDVPVLADNSQERLLLENYRYLYYLDKGEVEKALRSSDFIEQYVDELNEIYRPALKTDLFFNYAHYRKDLKKAANLYWDVEKYLKMDHNVVNLRVQMAHQLYVEELPKRAAATGQEALNIKDRFIMKGVIPLEERLISEMMELASSAREELAKKKTDDTLTEYKG